MSSYLPRRNPIKCPFACKPLVSSSIEELWMPCQTIFKPLEGFKRFDMAPRQVGNQMGLLYNMSHISAPASIMKSYFIPLPSHTCVKNVSLSLGEILCRDLKITSLSSFFPSTFFLESRAIQKLSRNHGMSGVSVKADIAKGVKSVEPPTAHRAI